MTEQPSDNIVLTFEQQQKIAAAMSRLDKVQDEVLKATTTRNELQVACIQLEKDKTYRDEELEKVNAKIAEVERVLASIETSAKNYTEIVEGARTETANLASKHTQREEEVTKKEQDIAERNAALSANEIAHAKKAADLDAKKTAIEKARFIMKDALNDATDALK